LTLWKNRFRKLIAASWVLLQSLALLVILLTPLWIRPSSETLSLNERIRKGPRSIEPMIATRQPTSITSRVIAIPGPAFRRLIPSDQDWVEELESEARQVRFEWVLDDDVSDGWRLQTIKYQRSEGSWEDVSLVANESGVLIGSVYVELAHGENIFTARMVHSRTQDVKDLRMRVAQKR
jgi:hypothetical protein